MSQPLDVYANAPDLRKVSIAGLIILAVFVGGALLWGLLAPLKAAVMAQGVVIVESQRKTIQHLEGGLVKEILVKEGDFVHKDDPLIALDSEMLRATVDLTKSQTHEELARIARLTAERNGEEYMRFPDEIARNRSVPEIGAIMAAEEKLFRARVQAYNSRRQMLISQKRQVEEEVVGLKEQLKSHEQEMAAINEQLKSNRTLLEEGYVTRTVVLELERFLAAKTSEKTGILAGISRGKEKCFEYEVRLNALLDERMEEATVRLRESQSRLLELRERLRAPKDALSRQVIRAPIDGTVVDLKVTTVGGVIAGKEPLMDIVPVNDGLIVEAKINVDQTKDVALGQHAEITFPAFKPSTHPPVEGMVTYISADRLLLRTPAGEMPYYKVYLEVDRKSLAKAGNIKLEPGMNASVSIITKERKAFEYFISPLRDRLRSTFREI